MTPYQERVTFLYSLLRFGIRLGLDNVRALLSILGNPEKGLSVIHVGGTNGKGSVAAMLAAIFTYGGYRVGLYTSPHLTDFRERIRIGDRLISEEQVVEITDRVKSALSLQPVPVTFFEFVTAMAFLYFREQGVDLVIAEVGMGGRLDATNVVDPLASVITKVALDHCQHLGNSLKEIAGEKLGIVKPGRPLVAGEREGELIPLFQARADEVGAPLFLIDRDFGYLPFPDGTFDFFGRRRTFSALRNSLLGRHQVENATIAIACLELVDGLGFPVGESDLRQGLLAVRWPGRMELVAARPPILLDCAHNPAGMKVLVDAVSDLFPDRSVVAVVGIMEDKDWPAMLRALASLRPYVITTRPIPERACPPDLLAEAASACGLGAKVVPPVAEALREARAVAGPEDVILVTGSIFTVGEARQALGLGLLS